MQLTLSLPGENCFNYSGSLLTETIRMDWPEGVLGFNVLKEKLSNIKQLSLNHQSFKCCQLM